MCFRRLLCVRIEIDQLLCARRYSVCLYFQVQMTKDYDWLQVHLNRKTWCNNVATIGMVGIFFRLYRSPAEYKMRPYS